MLSWVVLLVTLHVVAAVSAFAVVAGDIAAVGRGADRLTSAATALHGIVAAVGWPGEAV